MFRKIFISRNLPRDSSTFDVSFHEGLLNYKSFGSIFMILGIVLLLLYIIKFKNIPMMTFGLLFLILAGWCTLYVQNQIKTRKQCFYEGLAIEAIVSSHDRSAFTILANDSKNDLESYKDYAITLEFKSQDGVNRKKTIHNKSRDLWRTCPIGSSVIGLSYHSKSFFGEEMSTSMKFLNE